MQPGAAFAVALGSVFLAELGDKSQFLVMAQAARHPRRRILVEAVAAFALLTALAVTVGAALSRYLPVRWLLAASGLLFLLFAALAVRETREEPENDPVASRRVGGTFVLVLVSELGDKTQLATAALAASTGHALATGLGAWTALTASSVLAVLAGGWIGRRLPLKTRAWASAGLFGVLGVVALVVAAWP